MNEATKLGIGVWIAACVFLPSGSALAIGDYGPDTCAEGYVWREACGSSDHVCVTPDIRSQALEDNAQAASRRQPGGGAYGPDTCISGFVWREACGPNDRVCVPASTRARAADDNQHANERLKYPICSAYAQAAVDANKNNLKKKCGFSGPGWQSNFDAHFKWCLNVGAEAPIQETDARNQALAACVPYNCDYCNDGSCQCANKTEPQLCANHGGKHPTIDCDKQE